MRKRLGLPELADTTSEMNVIVQLGDGSVSVIVDRVGDVISVEPEQFEQAPATLKSPIRDIISGVYKLNDKLLLQLSPDKACEVQGTN
jgi:purine-binding chemotaxis protein CheW